jgi:hypothetical protein
MMSSVDDDEEMTFRRTSSSNKHNDVTTGVWLYSGPPTAGGTGDYRYL